MFPDAKLERDTDEMPRVRGESTPRVSTRAAQKSGHAFPRAYPAATVRSCEKIAHTPIWQAKPPAPPLQIQHLSWWRRRFRLRAAILSQLLKKRRPGGRSQYPAGTWKRMLPSELLVEECL